MYRQVRQGPTAGTQYKPWGSGGGKKDESEGREGPIWAVWPFSLTGAQFGGWGGMIFKT